MRYAKTVDSQKHANNILGMVQTDDKLKDKRQSRLSVQWSRLKNVRPTVRK